MGAGFTLQIYPTPRSWKKTHVFSYKILSFFYSSFWCKMIKTCIVSLDISIPNRPVFSSMKIPNFQTLHSGLEFWTNYNLPCHFICEELRSFAFWKHIKKRMNVLQKFYVVLWVLKWKEHLNEKQCIQTCSLKIYAQLLSHSVYYSSVEKWLFRTNGFFYS